MSFNFEDPITKLSPEKQAYARDLINKLREIAEKKEKGLINKWPNEVGVYAYQLNTMGLTYQEISMLTNIPSGTLRRMANQIAKKITVTSSKEVKESTELTTKGVEGRGKSKLETAIMSLETPDIFFRYALGYYLTRRFSEIGIDFPNVTNFKDAEIQAARIADEIIETYKNLKIEVAKTRSVIESHKKLVDECLANKSKIVDKCNKYIKVLNYISQELYNVLIELRHCYDVFSKLDGNSILLSFIRHVYNKLFNILNNASNTITTINSEY